MAAVVDAEPGALCRFLRFHSVGNSEGELCTLLNIALCPDFSAMAGDDTGNRCQTHACTRKLSLRMQALKRAKQAVCVTRIETYSVIANEIHRSGRLLGESKLDSANQHAHED